MRKGVERFGRWFGCGGEGDGYGYGKWEGGCDGVGGNTY